MAEYIFRWTHTDPLTGRRRTTRHRMREAEALTTLCDPVRVESSLLVIEPRPHGEGWSFASGLIENEHGAMLQPEPPRRE